MKNDDPLLGTEILCHVCGKLEKLHWNREVNNRLTETKMCFTCDHWNGHFEADKKRTNAVVVDGVHYMIEPDQKERRWSGFGGTQFIVAFKDGRRVVTHNLWCQGHITPQWRDKFSDNATFEKGT